MDRFRLMETFAAVVQAGSYTRAATALGVTVAMVSKRVQDLENDLGVRLLNRNTHGLSLTDHGADYHQTCVGLIGEMKANWCHTCTLFLRTVTDVSNSILEKIF